MVDNVVIRLASAVVIGTVACACTGSSSTTSAPASPGQPTPPSDAGNPSTSPSGHMKLPRHAGSSHAASSKPFPADAALPLAGRRGRLKPPPSDPNRPPLDVPRPVACGSIMCDPPRLAALGLTLRSCCADSKTEQCGVLSGKTCLPLGETAKPDSSCPTSSLPFSPPLSLPGCCSSSGTCGYMLALPGAPSLGCVQPSDLGLQDNNVPCQ